MAVILKHKVTKQEYFQSRKIYSIFKYTHLNLNALKRKNTYTDGLLF